MCTILVFCIHKTAVNTTHQLCPDIDKSIRNKKGLRGWFMHIIDLLQSAPRKCGDGSGALTD
jgi:hypothetical protein